MSDKCVYVPEGTTVLHCKRVHTTINRGILYEHQAQAATANMASFIAGQIQGLINDARNWYTAATWSEQDIPDLT